MKNKKVMISMIIGVFLVLAVVSFFYYKNGISAVSKEEKDVIVKIEPGMHANQILKRLDEAGLVNNYSCGKIFLKLNHYDHLQANTYLLKTNMSLVDIYNTLENPSFDYILKSTLTIKEGHTLVEIANEFAKILNVSKEDVLKQWNDQTYLKELISQYWFLDDSILKKGISYPLEGYLYPETYFITDEALDVKSITELALDMTSKKLEPYKEDLKTMKWTVHQFLTFASIVERESLFDEDRPQIAGVFMNRLKKGMLLQSDITVNYAWQRKGVDVSYKHLQIDSPYNTYKYVGLPIGPISTVSKVTMDACVHYSHHDYYYFFAKKDGKVIYSKTLQEHEKAVKENKWY